MKVTVRSVGLRRQVLGAAEHALDMPDGAAVRDLLARLAQENGEGSSPLRSSPKDRLRTPRSASSSMGAISSPQEYRETALKNADDVPVPTPIAGDRGPGGLKCTPCVQEAAA